jgi:hypothetical protein
MSTKDIPEVGPDAMDQAMHKSLKCLLEELAGERDPLLQAAKRNKQLLQKALDQGASIADLLEHFKSGGLTCKRDRLQAVLVKLDLWPARNQKGARDEAIE